MNKRYLIFKIQRYSPESDKNPYFKEYKVPIVKGMTILDALFYVKENLDSTLSYRSSCRMGLCGSCAMLINGIPKLACETQISDIDDGVIELKPLPNFPLIKDLIVDFTQFFNKHKRVKTYLIRRDFDEQIHPKVEYLQEKNQLKRLLLYAMCIKCGACYASCPLMIKNERFLGPEVLTKVYRYISDSRDEGIDERLPIIDSSIDGCWNCTTCSTCKLNCPKEVNTLDSIIETRSLIVERGMIQDTIREALESTYLNGNPWGGSKWDRTAWMKGLEIKNLTLGEKADLLYFVGCTPAYENRAQRIAKALTRILQNTNVDFGILGDEEVCCGNEIYNLGEKGLFEMLKEKNLELFNKYNITRLITSSPHCFNAFKNRYGKISFEVQHYTQYIAELIDKDKLKFSKKIEKKVTYHDPCYLGKINGIYDAPRKIIENIPGIKFEEMPRSKRMSLCCEGGGGLMWVKVAAPRLGEFRVKEALEIGAESILTACPFCFIMLDDAIKMINANIELIDVSELVLSAI
ncbi:MAG: succinate dehydrogenase iron-sulfur subunit [Nitrososphaerales archaeon]